MVPEILELRSGKEQEDGRLLWLTDTYGDHNGVSTVLKGVLQEIRLRDLPIDLLICSSTIPSGDHLIVVPPVKEFTIPLYRQQPFRIPNYLSVQRIFRRGRYNRIICSTEGPMGVAALWLRNVFSVETFFYLHTDWLSFAREVLALEQSGLRRIQRMLKLYYKRFDGIFVLNSEQQQWLTGKFIGIDPSRVFLTAHWVDGSFHANRLKPVVGIDALKPVAGVDVLKPVVIYAGRISKEKGVMELPAIMQMIWSVIPEVQLVVAGTGPAEEELKRKLPEAGFTGWIEPEYLQELYMASDILLLPSRFDTFSCVVLEALSCGLPVVAYNTKGPRDILEDSVSGYLVETAEEMAGRVIGFFLDPDRQVEMKQAALRRSDEYHAETIMDRLLHDIGLKNEICFV